MKSEKTMRLDFGVNKLGTVEGEATKVEINRLLPVMQEFHDYLKTHVKDPDGVSAKLQSLFPLAFDASNQKQLV